jgi:hypothetical protein
MAHFEPVHLVWAITTLTRLFGRALSISFALSQQFPPLSRNFEERSSRTVAFAYWNEWPRRSTQQRDTRHSSGTLRVTQTVTRKDTSKNTLALGNV